MDEKRIVMVGVGAVLLVSTITLLAVTLSASDEEDGGGGPDIDVENRTNPLLLISLDGFRSEYLYRQSPTLQTLARNGVMARYMMPSYPTITFPNHYTIVTGLYPESHGIVANGFYDPDYKEMFSMESEDGKWWGGEPIWNTLTRQNKTSFTYFWPGSDVEIDDLRPTHYENYDKTVPFETRIDQVVEWLSMGEEERPDWVSLYFEQPDSAGHEFGPDTIEVDDMVTYVDGMISHLLTGLRRNKMADKVNIIVLADHGMAPAGPDRHLNLTDYVPDIGTKSEHNTKGAFTMLRLKNTSSESVNGMLDKLSCPAGAPYIRAFPPQDLPTRFHYSNNKRIGDIVMDFNSGYYTTYTDYIENGEHGYDNHLATMQALFIATGPDFKSGETLEPFQNIEVYNLLCHLTGVEPAPNNGTEGSLYAALLDPPPMPEGTPEDVPEIPEYPDKLTNAILTMANCPGDMNETMTEEYQKLGLNISDPEQLVVLHLPWGVPSFGNFSVGAFSAGDVILLPHHDHVTGYSTTLKMPLWTSFTVEDIAQDSADATPAVGQWITDVRLDATTTQTCDYYENHADVELRPLFHPAFAANTSLATASFLVSNGVPMYTTARTVDYLAPILAPSQMRHMVPFNIMLGLVFDKNADSFPDTDVKPQDVPSDIFVVVTRCRQPIDSFQNCAEQDLDAFSFIVPVHETVNNNCEDDMNYAAMFLATVHDVELATGLTFYPLLDPSARLPLALRIKLNLWNINV